MGTVPEQALHIAARAGIACAATLCVWAWAPGAHAAARDRVHVDLAADCAGLEAGDLLLEEVQVRLPDSVTLVRGADPDAPTPWTLRWAWAPETGCHVMLSDIEPVVEFPLMANASESDIREAAVRVVWFLSMTEPRDPIAESPLKEAAPARLPEIPRRDARMPEIPQFPDAGGGEGEMPEIPTARRVETAPSVETAPGRDAALASSASARPSVLTSLSVTLADWRSSSPGLFETLDRYEEEPFMMSFGARRYPVGLNASFTGNVLTLSGKPAWLVGIRAGAMLDERIGLNVVYQGLTTTVTTSRSIEEGGEATTYDMQDMRLNLGGLEMEYVLWGREFMSISMAASLMAGGVSATGTPEASEETRAFSSFVMTSQLSAQVLLNVLPWLEVGIGAGYRAPIMQGNDQILDPRPDLAGTSGLFTLRLRLF